MLDCGGADADVDPELLKHLTIISPNESELANLTGTAPPRNHLPQHMIIAISDVRLASVALSGVHLQNFCPSSACNSILIFSTTLVQYAAIHFNAQCRIAMATILDVSPL